MLCHATQAREPSVGWEKISASTTSSLTFSCLIPQIAIPFIIMYGWVRGQQNSAQHQWWTEGKDKNSIY